MRLATSQWFHPASWGAPGRLLPILIVIVDTSELIEAFLPKLDELITEGLVVREAVDIVKYIGRPAPSQ